MSRDQVIELLRAADPVSENASDPDGFPSMTALLDRIDERSTDMQTHETQPRTPTPVEPAPAPRRQRRVPALAGAVVAVVVVVGIAAFALGGGGTSEVGAGSLDTVTTWIERFEQGDAAGYEALMADDATFECIECSYGSAGFTESGSYFPERNDAEYTDAGILGAADGSLNATCAEDGSTVSCDIRVTSVFGFVDGTGQPDNEYTAKLTFTLEDDMIVHYEHHAFSGNWFDYGLIKDYETWLQAEDPAAHEELFFFGTMLTGEASQVERHRDLVAQWAAQR